jgi:hypothetical protein
LPIWRVGAPPESWITDCALWDSVIDPGDLPTTGPIVLFSDDFNRTDSASLNTAGTNWTPNSTNWEIVSNRAQMGGTASPQFERVILTMGGPDHWVEGIVTPPDAVNPWVSAVAARYDTGTGGHYAVWKDSTAAVGSRIKLSRGTAANAYTLITSTTDTTTGATATSAAQVRLEVEGTAIRVHLYYSGAWHLVISTTDATYSTGDYVGISGYRTTGSSIVDDFYAGVGYLP